MEKKPLTVATALQNIELINLKIQEQRRLAAVAADKYKSLQQKEAKKGFFTAEEVVKVDLRKCPAWVTATEEVNQLTAKKRAVIMDTELYS